MKKYKISISPKLRTLLMGVSVALLFSCSSSRPTVSSHWKNNLSEDISDINYVSFTNPDVLLKVYNSNNALQIIVKVYNRPTQLNTLMNGLTIWIDPTNKEKKNFALTFPTAHPAMNDQPQFEQKKKEFDLSNLVLNVNYKGATIKYNNNETLTNRNEAYVMIDSIGNLNYIITLPYSKFSEANLMGKNISIGFLSERQEMNRNPNEGGMGDGMPGGGMGGGPGMGSGGGPGGGRNGGMPGGGMKPPPSGMGNPPENAAMSKYTPIKGWATIALQSN